MAIDIIPPGSSAVVTDNYCNDRRSGYCNDGRGDCGGRFRYENDSHPDRYDITSKAEVHATATALASSLTDKEAAKSFSESQKQVSDFYSASLLEAAKNAAAGSIQSQKESSDLSVQALTFFNGASVQAQNFNNLTSVQAMTNYNNLNVQAVMNASAAALQAQVIASASAAQAAECCCELKEKITADGQKTRDLMTATTQQDLRDRAQRSETALAAYFSAKVAPLVPVVG